ncbi:MAG: ABC transporter ATP-binding protein [Alphaproteobacteria bacterium]|nr:ABC transporter ATP-binding protein [Alphaproteobacteria bacterium]
MTKLSVDNLRLRYGDVEVLKGVSMTLAPGEVVALLGASGSGKTTLLRAIAGLEEPHDGRIDIAGRTVFDGAAGIDLAVEERNLGLVFQSYALWPHRTVAQNVAFPLTLRHRPAGEVKEKVQAALDQLGLGHLGERFPHQLSGGQQQRVAIARALVYNPPVVLLDEPLSNLDAKLREEARLWLRRLITSLGLSAICVTHDQVEAMAIADRILLLDQGRIEQEGSPQEMYGAPRTLIAAEFMGSNNRLAGRLVRRDGERGWLDLGDGRVVEGVVRDAARREGDDAVGLIRLEQVGVAAEPGGNSLALSLAAQLYLGDRWELAFETGGQPLRAFTAGPAPAGVLHVDFPPRALWIF